MRKLCNDRGLPTTPVIPYTDVMKLAFTTLACPKWDLPTVLNRAVEYGFDAIDFRGIGEKLDITVLREFTTQLGETAKTIAATGLKVSGISSSIRLCDPVQCTANVEEAQRTIPVAKGLGCNRVRMFGGGAIDRHGREGAAKIAQECMQRIQSLPGAGEIQWLIETHDNWTSGQDVLMLLNAVRAPNVGILWDIAHPQRFNGESVDQTFSLIGPMVRYTHVKDCRHEVGHPQAGSDGWRYVTPGTGEIQLRRAVQLLKRAGYNGYLTLEHEKRWHPDLPEPEQALPAFVAWARQVLREV